MDTLEQCVEVKNINYSYARESIYKVLLQADNCLSVNDIMVELVKMNTKKISLNTIYRHLTLFEKCNLLIVIQDKWKKAYYYLINDQANVFLLCPKCNYLSHFNDSEINTLLKNMTKYEFITIHRKCMECK